jgi:hypothetical protein
MQLQPVDIVDDITPADFRKHYFEPKLPLVMRNLAKAWPAYTKWNWDYLIEVAGSKKLGIYNNVKSDAYTPINKADDYTTFGEYINMIRKGPAQWRIFFFNIFSQAPQLREDFTWPTPYIRGFLKALPSLFAGGEGSITHMHFDIDMPHLMHTQFMGRKRVLLFPNEEQYKLYRKPFEVLSLADFSNYYDAAKSKVDVEKFPALKLAAGYDVILEPGDTLFMPSGYWHHMEYLQSGFAMSLRALDNTLGGKLKGLWNVAGMRNIDTLMKKTAPHPWYHWKQKRIQRAASRELQALRP